MNLGPNITFKNIQVTQGKFKLENLNLSVESGSYTILMGGTGCGKTTLLEILCGLRTPLFGQVFRDEIDITQLKPGARGIGYVPQDRALFHNLSVKENLTFALKLRKIPRQEIESTVKELSGWLRIQHLLDREIWGLSGGESQRVALGRALAFGPQILCLDEPLSALDESMRDEVTQVLREAHQRTGATVLHVTHSRLEANTLGTRILKFYQGQIVEDSQAKERSL